jgi:hypothetical protein
MDLYERYTLGHYAGDFEPSNSSPLWAQALGWDGMGAWITVDPDDLAKAIPGLKIYATYRQPATVLIGRPDSNAFMLPNFFERLQNMNFNVIALTPNQHLVCLGASLVTGVSGATELVGIFELEAQASPALPKLVLPVHNKLVLVEPPGTAELPVGLVGVPFFRVPCKITMNSGDVSHQLEEEDETHQMVQPRRSFIRPVFLSQARKVVGSSRREEGGSGKQQIQKRNSKQWAAPFFEGVANRMSGSQKMKIKRDKSEEDDDLL